MSSTPPARPPTDQSPRVAAAGDAGAPRDTALEQACDVVSLDPRSPAVRLAARQVTAAYLARQQPTLAAIDQVLGELLPVLAEATLHSRLWSRAEERLVSIVLGMHDAVDAELQTIAVDVDSRDPLSRAMRRATIHTFCNTLRRMAETTSPGWDTIWERVLARYISRYTQSEGARRGWRMTH